jgi:TatD DNase family protein
MEQFTNDVNDVILKALEQGITKIVVPGVDIESSQKAIDLAEKFPCVYAAVGVHPNEGLKWTDDTRKQLQALIAHPKVVAVGEIGLDYYWDDCPRETQKNVLESQLRIAEESRLPVIIHSRNALADVIEIIQQWKRPWETPQRLSGVMHAFEGDLVSAKTAIELGFLIGIGGPVTYKNATAKHELAEKLDLNVIVLETDAPYLTPIPFRGKRNLPEYVNLIAEKIAQIRNIQLKLISQATTNNANKLFAWES